MDAVCVLVAAHAYTHAEGAGSYLSVSGGSHRTEEPQSGMSA